VKFNHKLHSTIHTEKIKYRLRHSQTQRDNKNIRQETKNVWEQRNTLVLFGQQYALNLETCCCMLGFCIYRISVYKSNQGRNQDFAKGGLKIVI